MLRRSKDEVLALPPKLRTWLPVEVPAGTGARAIKKVFELLAGKDGSRPRRRATSSCGGAASCSRFLVEARQALAFAKTTATLDFVTGAIDQGEKVIVFSCFDDPIQKLANELRLRGRRRDRQDAGDDAAAAGRSVPAGRRGPRVRREHHRRRHRAQPDRGDAGRVQRSRLGARPTTGRPRTAPTGSARRARSTSPTSSPRTRSTTSSRRCSRPRRRSSTPSSKARRSPPGSRRRRARRAAARPAFDHRRRRSTRASSKTTS